VFFRAAAKWIHCLTPWRKNKAPYPVIFDTPLQPANIGNPLGIFASLNRMHKPHKTWRLRGCRRSNSTAAFMSVKSRHLALYSWQGKWFKLISASQSILRCYFALLASRKDVCLPAPIFACLLIFALSIRYPLSAIRPNCHIGNNFMRKNS
jgi:hypothetical protein